MNPIMIAQDSTNKALLLLCNGQESPFSCFSQEWGHSCPHFEAAVALKLP
jgi:hypothetical protein